MAAELPQLIEQRVYLRLLSLQLSQLLESEHHRELYLRARASQIVNYHVHQHLSIVEGGLEPLVFLLQILLCQLLPLYNPVALVGW